MPSRDVADEHPREATPGTSGPAARASRLETVVSRSVEETEAVARNLGARLAAGTTILLRGDLGAGKTAFVRGLAAGLGIDPSEVSSPTFTIVQEYRGRRRLQHVDLYRLEPGFDVEELALDEFAARGDVVAIEWAERAGQAPDPRVEVTIEDLGADVRRITIGRMEPGERAERAETGGA
jgi:tRNA threonylcarbamoyladenosine biosynthesis protein TsaE